MTISFIPDRSNRVKTCETTIWDENHPGVESNQNIQQVEKEEQ